MSESELDTKNGKTKASKLSAIKFQKEARHSYMRQTQMQDSLIDAERGTILIVDDTQDNLLLLSLMLSEQGYRIRKAVNGETAIKIVQKVLPDLILLDINMPGMDGYEVCKQLKADPVTANIPVIFLSAFNEVFDKVKAFAVGAVDYIAKPFHLEEVLVRVENQLTIYTAKIQVDRLNEELEQRVRQRTAQLEATNRELEKEIIERKKIQHQLEASNLELEKEIVERQKIQELLWHMALHDNLTDLPNRGFFIKQLEKAIKRSSQEEDYLFAVLFLDCDRFKVVNDSLGHLVGDKLLIAVGHRLKSCLGSTGTIARFGGDEFTILLEEIKDIRDTTATAEKLLEAMSEPFSIQERDIFINLSIGIVIGSKEYQQPEMLLRDADIAMYRAKEMGKACYQVFEKGMHDRAQKLMELETDLRLASDRSEFVVHYQPIVSLNSGKISGFEALVRWKHPKKGFLSPTEFIPIAEETGLIVPIGLEALREACNQLKTWQNQKITSIPLTISVNLSVKQFSQPNLIEEIDKILEETELEGSSLKLEITESAIINNDMLATEILQKLKSRKIQLLIDDFGTGYSSLSYLHRFPVDTIKIDRSFVSRITENGENVEIVKAIIKLAQDLNIGVIAEGIETPQQCKQIKDLGCEFGQGFFFSKPLEQQSVAAIFS
ncbi:MAG: EAL domain-containing protein [Prochloraceae cyanobacterium]|nr:EAL domain-containing protein [Prochloraceae cyanobacterium]